MRVERALERLGGVATAAELHRLTSRSRLRVAVARGRVVRDARGSYSLPGADDALRAASRLNGLLCLDSAALFYGWKVKRRPVEPAVAVPRNRKLSPERRIGVRVVYVDLDPADVRHPATSPLFTVLHCACRLPFDEALTIADSAVRSGDVAKPDMLAAAQEMPDRYRRRCLRVAREADPRADNPFESVLRAIALDVPGLRVTPQVWIGSVGRSDLADRRLGLVIEAESFEFHGLRRLLKADCERYNAFVTRGWLVVRFAWEHVMFEPNYVREVLEGMVVLLTRQPQRRALAPEDQRRSA